MPHDVRDYHRDGYAVTGGGFGAGWKFCEKSERKTCHFYIVYHEKVAIVKNEKNIIIKIKIRMQS